MLPDLARRAIEAYSDPGDLVVDPMCGIGTTLVEAVHLGRDAIGIELERRWAKLARRNLTHAARDDAAGRAHVLTGDARELPRLLARHHEVLDEHADGVARIPSGAVDLVVFSPPYGCDLIEVHKARAAPASLEEARNYGRDTKNLGNARGQQLHGELADVYEAAASVVKPGGFLVVVTKETRSKGQLRDLASATIRLCQHAGLVYWQHVVALLATVRGDELVPRVSFWQRVQTRRAIERGDRAHLICHEDVLVFRKPEAHR